MTVKEWREKHPKCSYCLHLKIGSMAFFEASHWCGAKEKDIWFAQMPRLFCKIFEPKEYPYKPKFPPPPHTRVN